MSPQLNISIALIVFMGLVTGGMLALTLMTTRRNQVGFSIILGLAALLAVMGVFASVANAASLAEALVNATVLLILSFALGYSLTTFSVLSYSGKAKAPDPARQAIPGRTAVILLGPGEPPEYGVKSASRRLALAEDAADAPPNLIRPFYLRDIRSKYATIGSSPYKENVNNLALRVQARLDSNHRVYTAFYSDGPGLSGVAVRAMDEGAERIVLQHVRVTNPPDAVVAGDLLEGLRPQGYGVEMIELQPLYNCELLPQAYVRRVAEAVPQVSANPDEVGLLLVGRGHPYSEGKESTATVRFRQEDQFQRRVRQALIKAGFNERRVAMGWLRWDSPRLSEALSALAAEGCKSVLWMPSSFPADGIITLYDIPAELNATAREKGVKLASLGAWNGDDLAAEEIAVRVRAASVEATQAAPARSAL